MPQLIGFLRAINVGARKYPMQELRAVADELELNTAESYWPFPTYGDLLFSI